MKTASTYATILWVAVSISAIPCSAQSSTPIPSAFFAMSSVKGDYPKVTIGTLAHSDFAWPRIEPTRGTFNFQFFDDYMSLLQQHGLVDSATNTANTAMTLAAGTPGWAVANQSSCSGPGTIVCTAPPDNIQDWKDFVTAVVQHYNGKTQPHMRYYELWNEFNVSLWWTGTDAQMVALAQAAYPIIHQDPHSLLLTPSVAGPVGTTASNSGVTWMTRYLQAGGSQYADGGTFHGYLGAQNGVVPFPMPEDDATAGCKPATTCYGSIITKATQMRAVFDQNGLAGKPMFQTEGSWGNETVTDLDTQIAWITRFFLLQAGLRSTLNLQMAAWFTWGGGTTFGWGDIEDASLNPTAAALAYDQVYHWLVGATMNTPCSSTSDGTWTCALSRPGGYVARAVWNAKGSISYTPGSGFTQYRDVTGATTPIPAAGAITIGAKPLLVEGSTVAAAGAPNIVLILTDDQDVQLGTLDYMPNVKNLLASQGTSFNNFLVPLSLCCPSRTTILRGQYPHNSGLLTNALPDGGFERAYIDNLEASTVATLLHGAGYRTVLLGKYLNGYPDSASATYIPPGWDEWYSPGAGNPYSEYNYSLNENGKLVPYNAAATDYLTDVIYGKATDFIQRAATNASQPFFIYFATYAPHSPYTPAPRHANLFPGMTAPHPPSFNEADVSDKPAYIAQRSLLTQSEIATIDTDYRMRLQALQAVDEAVAGLLNTLSTSGRLANTYVIFASDNGYHMGEHRLTEGKYTPYATDIHVPLIIRGPGVAANVVRNQLVSNVDLAETIADMAGIPPLDFSDGRSIKPLLSATPATAWRQGFLLEEFNGGNSAPLDPLVVAASINDPTSAIGLREPPDPDDLLIAAAAAPAIPSYYGFQAPGYKYVEYETGEKELYLASDTYEITNVASLISPTLASSLSSYMHTLNLCKADGCRTAEAVAPPALLTADFTMTPASPTASIPVTLTASAAGTAPYAFSWTIDSKNQTGQTVSVQLGNGTHTVTLNVTDAIGATASVTKSVTVNAPGRIRRVKH